MHRHAERFSDVLERINRRVRVLADLQLDDSVQGHPRRFR